MSALAFEHRHDRLRFALGGQRHTQVRAQPVAAMRDEASTKRWARQNWRLGLCDRLDISMQWKNNYAIKRLARHFGRR